MYQRRYDYREISPTRSWEELEALEPDPIQEGSWTLDSALGKITFHRTWLDKIALYCGTQYHAWFRVPGMPKGRTIYLANEEGPGQGPNEIRDGVLMAALRFLGASRLIKPGTEEEDEEFLLSIFRVHRDRVDPLHEKYLYDPLPWEEWYHPSA